MNSTKLTLEQQFKLKILEIHIQNLNQQQAQKLLLKFVQLGMMKDNIISNYIQTQSIEP
ncbi:phycobilisome degradation protein NblA [Halotia branconii]|uniref:Phycobilisome degradation protein NblA n=1 Tax=Halotia branconii CENA392 TaxID=1539056 RepID=A0AAJ6P819_9CYAN|nr:phycobilisome degradation protein NblA [Halotia branconii]WGV24329.1 phycobilisome degradation protein NblA [Halotia branconii CENA392]